MSTDLVSERVAALLASPREVNGVRVVTLPDVARVHGKPASTVERAWRRRRDRFEEGVDYVFITDAAQCAESVRTANGRVAGRSRGSVVALTQTGYSLLTKVFDDDISWALLRELARFYFAAARSMAVPDGWRLVKVEDLQRIVAMTDEQTRLVAKAAGMARPSDAAAMLGLRRHDSTPGPKQTQRAGRKMLGWQKAPDVREAAKIGARENPAQALIDSVSYTVLTDRGGSDLASLIAGLVEQAVPAAIEKALAARAAGGAA